MNSARVIWWWSFLCGVAALNILAWSASAWIIKRRRADLSPAVYSAHRWQLLLSAVYVFGCAFRSALPVFDVPRFCLVNSWLSSVIVGRSVASVAEVCFVAQWSVMLRHIAKATGSISAGVASLIMVPLILVAEICSWYSVLTTSNLGHVAEESLWGLTVALLVGGMLASWPLCSGRGRRLVLAGCVAGAGYVTYMFSVDVPMYWARWLADEAGGRRYLSATQGLSDVASRWVVSHRWEDWKSEMVWMGLYFSVAVWISISLIHAPLSMRTPGPGPGPQRRP